MGILIIIMGFIMGSRCLSCCKDLRRLNSTPMSEDKLEAAG